MDFGFTSVAAITVICYLVMEILKTTPINRKWLPIISGVLGGGIGVLAMMIMPSYPASDYLNAIAIGIVSGLAATGINQVAKQLKTPR
ncbi:Phage holin family Hol44, holin superfamily V [Sporobacter termitidis DSM 10068]|uniref:Phage holin family Hol44, holin superfamily V n=1 Tax=Sporobacter termitidis DSM 10068 TaxID=1123282 RepID=A0A1M5Z8P9_9FIRM|nr:phage holin family protein [Sporobacter termitidis]SHI20582.1 Phage holin family Hol44, holin superfamily V [Sporobacter termitidis DSM 10068]